MRTTSVGIGVAVMVALLTPASALCQINRGFRTELPADGPGSSIGVTVKDLTSETGGPGGAVVDSVQPDSPAARAGFRAGDVVIEFDGERIRSARQFARVVQETRPAAAVGAVVMRGGSRETLTVTPELGRVPNGAQGNFRVVPRTPFSLDLDQIPNGWFTPAAGRLGAAVMALDDQLATFFGVRRGVLVTSVSAGSPAAAAGLRAGDVILDVNGRTVDDPSDVADAVRAVQPGADVKLRVMRDKKETELTAVIPRAPDRVPRSNRETI